MANHSDIQWTDSTVNPVMGCDGCELFESREQVTARVAKALAGDPKEARQKVAGIAERFVDETPLKASHSLIDALVEEKLIEARQAKVLHADTKAAFRCYAATLCEIRHSKEGWPDKFDQIKLFPGRMAETAALKDLAGTERVGEVSGKDKTSDKAKAKAKAKTKPWLNGQPRLIFVSDMGDALSAEIEFEFLRNEIITNVTSAKGSRHVWQWVTKRPKQMAKFATWLAEQGIPWPDNLVAMTTVTSKETAYRVNDLRAVPAKMRGLSIEPLWGEITLDLTGINWVIVGGESGSSAEPFHVEWALSLREQCQKAGAAFFFKQLGAKPFHGGDPLKVKDAHGGEWDEWPDAAWRVREVPQFDQLVKAAVVALATLAPEDADYRATREKVVDEGISSSIKAAKALKEIYYYKDGLLWKQGFKTFEAYCSAKWGYEKSHAYRLVDSGKFVALLEEYNKVHSPQGENVAMPINESQIRPILQLDEEVQVERWKEVVAGNDVKTLTRDSVAEKVKAYLPPKAARVKEVKVEAIEIVAKASSPTEVLDGFVTSIAGHPKIDEITTLVDKIKALITGS